VQVYLYYISFPNDPAARKWFVHGLFTLEWVHTVFQTVGTFVNFTSSSSDVVVIDFLCSANPDYIREKAPNRRWYHHNACLGAAVCIRSYQRL